MHPETMVCMFLPVLSYVSPILQLRRLVLQLPITGTTNSSNLRLMDAQFVFSVNFIATPLQAYLEQRTSAFHACLMDMQVNMSATISNAVFLVFIRVSSFRYQPLFRQQSHNMITRRRAPTSSNYTASSIVYGPPLLSFTQFPFPRSTLFSCITSLHSIPTTTTFTHYAGIRSQLSRTTNNTALRKGINMSLSQGWSANITPEGGQPRSQRVS